MQVQINLLKKMRACPSSTHPSRPVATLLEVQVAAGPIESRSLPFLRMRLPMMNLALCGTWPTSSIDPLSQVFLKDGLLERIPQRFFLKKLSLEEQLEFDKEWFAKKNKKADACCTPDQWEGYQFSFDEKHHFRAGFNISYDFTGKRLRIAAYEVRNKKKLSLESLALFKEKQLYIIDYTANNCGLTTPNHAMQRDCIPGDAHKTEITIGGSLNADVYDYAAMNNTARVIDTRTKSCLPIYSAIFDDSIAADIGFSWDLTTGSII